MVNYIAIAIWAINFIKFALNFISFAECARVKGDFSSSKYTFGKHFEKEKSPQNGLELVLTA